jgi:hypothetical protein
MGTFLSYTKATDNHFTVSYPHYGLFKTADVTVVNDTEDPVFECKLLNGAVVLLKKLAKSRWIDAQLNQQTSLANVLGMYIDDFIGTRH